MRSSALVAIAALLLLVWGFSLYSSHGREFTTTSDEAYSLYLQGNEQFHSFQWTRAESSLRQALALDPGFTMAQATLAVLIRELAEPAAAKAALARAESLVTLVANDEERMLIQLRLGKYGLVSGCVRDSVLTLLRGRLPDHPIVLSTRALIAMEEQRGEEAAELWRELVEFDPNNARAHNWLGYNAAYMGRYDEALSHLRKYAYLAPNIANPHDSLGEILSYIGRYEEAVQEYRAALELQPDFFPSLLKLAQVYIEQGQLRKGLAILEQVRGQITGTQYERKVDQQLIRVYYAHDLARQLDTALAEYGRRHPADELSCFYESLYLARNGELAAGRALCDSFLYIIAQKGRQVDKQTRADLARLEFSTAALFAEVMGDAEQAADRWGRVLASSEQLPPHRRYTIHLRYGEALAAGGRHAEALGQAEEILALNPRLIKPLMLKVRSALALERLEEAHTTFTTLQALLSGADSDHPLRAEADSLRLVIASRQGS